MDDKPATSAANNKNNKGSSRNGEGAVGLNLCNRNTTEKNRDPGCERRLLQTLKNQDFDFDDLVDLISETASEIDFTPLDREEIKKEDGKIYESLLHVPREVWKNANEQKNKDIYSQVLQYVQNDEAAEKLLLQNGKNIPEGEHNICNETASKNHDTLTHGFYAIWDCETMQKIADETNKYARAQILRSKQPHRQWKDTDADELYMLLAFYVFIHWRKRYTQVNEEYGINYFELPQLKYNMTPNRFKALIQCLHFVDNSTTFHLKGANLQIAKIKPITDHCSSKFESLYKLSQTITINDSMPIFAGQDMNDYLHAKATGIGKRLYELSDAHTGYVWRVLPHGGRNADRDSSGDDFGYGANIVLKLTDGIRSKGYTLLIDECLNSPVLSKFLKQQGTNVVGPVRVCHTDIPEEVKSLVNTENLQEGHIVTRNCGDLSINVYVDKISSSNSSDSTKVNVILSTDTGDNAKPNKEQDSSKFYEESMKSIDNREKKLQCSTELTNDINIKWYILAFTRLFELSMWNAYILYRRDVQPQRKPMSYDGFLNDLINYIMDRHMSLVAFESIQNMKRLSNPYHFPVSVAQFDKQNITKRDITWGCQCCKIRGKHTEAEFGCHRCEVPLCIVPCFRDYHTVENLRAETDNETSDDGDMDWDSSEEGSGSSYDCPGGESEESSSDIV